MSEPIDRQAVRAILLTPEHEILLLRIYSSEKQEFFWIAPGGGLEAGEIEEAGLRRELREEVGLEEFVLGPLLWRRQHTFNWKGKRYRQSERYFAVHVPRFDPRISDHVEAQVIRRFRWWPVAELQNASERLTPLSLATIVSSYLIHGAHVELPPVEILVE